MAFQNPKSKVSQPRINVEVVRLIHPIYSLEDFEAIAPSEILQIVRNIAVRDSNLIA